MILDRILGVICLEKLKDPLSKTSLNDLWFKTFKKILPKNKFKKDKTQDI